MKYFGFVINNKTILTKVKDKEEAYNKITNYFNINDNDINFVTDGKLINIETNNNYCIEISELMAKCLTFDLYI